jgi:hypothetical protein
MQELIIKLILKHTDEEALLKDIASSIVEPAIDKIVKETPTKIDDTLKAVLYNQLEKALIDEVLKLLKGLQ